MRCRDFDTAAALRAKRLCSDALTRCNKVQSQRYAYALLASGRDLQNLALRILQQKLHQIGDSTAMICRCPDPSVYDCWTTIQASIACVDAMRYSIPERCNA
jgi:hypothetical protein